MGWIDWIRRHEGLTWTMAGVSALISLGGILAVPLVVTYLPADYFVNHSAGIERWRHRHPVLRWGLWMLKNATGLILLLLGIIMLFAPGPGLLGVLVGLSLLNFPGKRRLECWLIGRKSIHSHINALRARAGRLRGLRGGTAEQTRLVNSLGSDLFPCKRHKGTDPEGSACWRQDTTPRSRGQGS